MFAERVRARFTEDESCDFPFSGEAHKLLLKGAYMLNLSRKTCVMVGAILATMSQICAISVANAQGAIVTGRVMLVEGHEGPTCRRLRLRLDNGSELWFRLPDTGVDNSILAVGLTAIATGKKVDLAYVPGIGTGCGTEPKVNWISLLAE